MSLYKMWEWFNYHCFDGELVRPNILLYKSVKIGDDVVLGAYHPSLGIYISYEAKNEPSYAEVLYHEMCHQFACQEYDHYGHGPVFWEIYEEGIKRILALPASTGYTATI